MRNYYDLLGVPISATKRDIQLAFRKLAVKYHPDKNPRNASAEEHFKEINRAYQVLSDPVKRRRYDSLLQFGQAKQPGVRPGPHKQQRPQPNAYQSSANRSPRKPKPKRESFAEKVKRMGKATVFTLLIIFAINVFMNVASTRAYTRDSIKLEMQEEAQRAQFDLIDSLFGSNDLNAAFDQLHLLYLAFPTNFNIESYYNKQLLVLNEQAIEDIKHQDLERALVSVKVLNAYTLDQDHQYEINFLMADINRKLGHYEKAIDILDKIEPADQNDYRKLLEMALIYKNQIGDYETADTYFQQVSEIIRNKYMRRYGNAYYLVPHALNLPEAHFELFFEKGVNDYLRGDYEASETALEWATYCNSAKIEPYLYFGLIEWSKGNADKACFIWNKAYTALPSAQLADIIQEHCGL